METDQAVDVPVPFVDRRKANNTQRNACALLCQMDSQEIAMAIRIASNQNPQVQRALSLLATTQHIYKK